MENYTSKNLRVCKRCLTRDMMDKADYFKSMYDYIENLDSDIKTEASLYEKRLAICKECDRLADGMCRGCGCFVEMRAAITKNACPYEKW